MAKNNENILSWVLAILGLTTVSFAAGLHRLVWMLYWALTVIWVALFYFLAERKLEAHASHIAKGYSSDDDLTIYWVLGIGAPVVVAIVLKIVEGIVYKVLGVTKFKQ